MLHQGPPRASGGIFEKDVKYQAVALCCSLPIKTFKTDVFLGAYGPRVPVNDDKTAKSLRIWSSVSGYFYEVKTGNKQSKPVLTKYLQDPTTVTTWMKSSKKVKRSVFSRKESTLWRGLLFPGDIVKHRQPWFSR